MIKYLLKEGGIKNRETGASIPLDESNRHYREYLEWCEGNTPIPIQPSPYHKLVDDIWVENKEIHWQDIRLERNILLVTSDWTQLADLPLWARQKLSAFRKYRQALRDIPQDFEEPSDIIWPKLPNHGE